MIKIFSLGGGPRLGGKMAAEEVSGNIVDTQSRGQEDDSGTLDEPVYVTIVSVPLVIINLLIII